MKHLHSLSIAPCCLVKSPNTTPNNSICYSNKKIGKQSNLIERPDLNHIEHESEISSTSQSTSNAIGTTSKISVLPGYSTRHAAQQRDFEARVIKNGSGLDDLVQGLTNIEKLELIAVGYSSVFSVPMNTALDSFVWYDYNNIIIVLILYQLFSHICYVNTTFDTI